MALPTNQYFSNAIVGNMQAGTDVNIYDIHTTPRLAIGTGFARQDGAKFRYASFDTTVAAGRLVSPIFANSGKATTDNIIIATTSAVAVAGELATPGSVGSKYVQMTIASTAANKYAGGYLVIEDGSGKNYIYRIKGNTATDNPATGDIRVSLHDAIQVTLTTNTDIQLIPSLYNDVDVCSVATNWAVAGVSMAAMTAGTFGWVCTSGLVTVLQDGTLAGGCQVAASNVTNGAVMINGGIGTGISAIAANPLVGYCVQIGATTENASVRLMLE